jgi:hypothetical protein
LSRETVSLLVAGAGALFALAAAVLSLSATASREVRRRVEGGGRKVMRLKAKWLRSPFATGLSPLAIIYRVTTQVGEDAAKVKLYAYDPGQWLSRTTSPVRQFSGGVWRDA